MKKVLTRAGMKKLDRLAQKKYNIPSIILMENAGRAAAEEILKRFKRGKAAVFCGRGNNGGDGFVTARYLVNKGIETAVFILGRSREIKNKDPLANLAILKKMNIKIKEIIIKKDIEQLKRSFRYDFIVDAIFGIGFKGRLPRIISELVSFLNKTQKPVYALDVPSGLDATKGKAAGECMKAYKTITFGLPKKGFLQRGAGSYVGRLVVKNIGFPRQLLQ